MARGRNGGGGGKTNRRSRSSSIGSGKKQKAKKGIGGESRKKKAPRKGPSADESTKASGKSRKNQSLPWKTQQSPVLVGPIRKRPAAAMSWSAGSDLPKEHHTRTASASTKYSRKRARSSNTESNSARGGRQSKQSSRDLKPSSKRRGDKRSINAILRQEQQRQRGSYRYCEVDTSSSRRIESVPWLQSGPHQVRDEVPVAAQERTASAETANNKANATKKGSGILPTNGVPDNVLNLLNDELLAFSNYVKLSPNEVKVRKDFIDFLGGAVKDAFQKSKYHKRFDRPTTPEASADDETPRLEVFGSFATLNVCTYNSDIDLSLWGVVPGEKKPAAQRELFSKTQSAKPPEIDESTRPEDGLKPQATGSLTDQGKTGGLEQGGTPSGEKVPRKDLVSKWAQALDAYDNANEISQGPSPGRQSVSRQTTNDDTSKRVEPGNSQSETSGCSGLFFIDRVGEQSTDSHAKDATNTNGEKKVALQNGVPRDLIAIESSDESDVDDADKLESFRTTKAFDGTEHNPISLSSASNSDSDDLDGKQEDDDDQGNDVDTMEVSFISQPRSAASRLLQSSPLKVSGRARDQCVFALTALYRTLRRRRFMVPDVLLIKKARVPIIKMKSSLGFEADIAVGGHNGADTRHYAASQVKRFESFAPVVLFLKVLLAQEKLDTPFEGGIGSYKLYVLVAYHIHHHLAAGGVDEPGEILLSFFFRYSGSSGLSFCGKPVTNPKACLTRLSQDVPLHCPDEESNLTDCSGVADLSNVFLIDRCVQLFRYCWHRLTKRLKQVVDNDGHDAIDTSDGSRRKRRKLSKTKKGPESFLDSLVNPTTLHYDRSQSAGYGVSSR